MKSWGGRLCKTDWRSYMKKMTKMSGLGVGEAMLGVVIMEHEASQMVGPFTNVLVSLPW